eukprot:jgi/Ulvmu1/9955/UM059_0003.1
MWTDQLVLHAGNDVQAEAAGVLYIASVAQRKYLEPTLDAFCQRFEHWAKCALSLRQFCQLCAIQLLLWSDPRQDYLNGLTAKDTAGWVLLYIQLRAVHKGSLSSLSSQFLSTNACCIEILRKAMAAQCGDLAMTLNGSILRGNKPVATEDAAIPHNGGIFHITPSDVEDQPVSSEVATAASSLVEALQTHRATLAMKIHARARLMDQIEEEHGIRKAIERLEPETHELLASGGMQKTDQEVIDNIDRCTRLLQHLTPSDLASIRGRKVSIQVLRDNGLLDTSGIVLNGFISTLESKDLVVGSKVLFDQFCNGINYMRLQIWWPFLMDVESQKLDKFWSDTIRNNAPYQQTMKIIIGRINDDIKATGRLSNKAETTDSLPTDQELHLMHVRGWAAGCIEQQDAYPIRQDAIPPAGSNGIDILKLNQKTARTVSNMYHQYAMMMPMLLRGNDACELRLSALAPYTNTSTAPMNQSGVQVRLQFSKTNNNDRLETKALVDGASLHSCALPNFAVHVWGKLNKPDGAPLKWAHIQSGEWRQFQILDLSVPNQCFRNNSAKHQSLTTRLQTFHSQVFGRNNIKTILHLIRRMGAEALHQSGTVKDWLQQARGWQQNSSLDSAYALGAHPGAALAAAGFRGLESYYPAQRTAMPPDAIVNLILGVVLEVSDPDTGSTAELHIDAAIAKSEQFFQSSASKGHQSATPMLKALRVMADSLARVGAR